MRGQCSGVALAANCMVAACMMVRIMRALHCTALHAQVGLLLLLLLLLLLQVAGVSHALGALDEASRRR
jgi:hypothetical protein